MEFVKYNTINALLDLINSSKVESEANNEEMESDECEYIIL